MKEIFSFLIFIISCNVYSNNYSVEKIKKQDNCYSQKKSKDEEILAQKIKALIFLNKPKVIPSEELKCYNGIKVKGLEIKNFEKFKNYFSCFFNRPLTFKILNDIRLHALCYFKENTNYLVDVKILDDQDVTDGKVQIFVQIAKIGDVSASGAKYFSNSKIEKDINVRHGEYVNIEKIRKYIVFLNKNPFRQVLSILKPGENPGYTDIHFYTEDFLPIKIFGGYENTGNEIASQSRFLVGLNFGNFCNLDHIANIEFKTAPSVNKWWGITGDYTIPMFDRTYLKIIGSFVKTNPESEEDYDLKGEAWVLLFRYYIPVKSSSRTTNEIIFGYDFKRTDNFLSFFERACYSNYIDISQFVFQFNGNACDKYGLTSYLLSLYFSPGDMTKHNDNENFQEEGYAKKSKYTYVTFHFDRTFNLPKNFLYVIDFFSKFSTTKLLPTEQISLGGYSTIRGYQENEVYGDKGFYLKNEARSPKICFKKIENLRHELQFLAFVDFGYVADINQNVSEKKSNILASVGPGLRYTIQNKLIVKLDYGVQLKNIERKYFNKSWHSKIHLFATIQY